MYTDTVNKNKFANDGREMNDLNRDQILSIVRKFKKKDGVAYTMEQPYIYLALITYDTNIAKAEMTVHRNGESSRRLFSATK